MTLNHYQRLFLHYYLNDAKDDPVKKRLATHVCPVPADPAMKCTLPEIINITL